MEKSHIKRQTDKTMLLLLALKKINEGREYYKGIDHLEDLPHNMDTLFNDLDTLHGMLYEEIEGIEDLAEKLEEK